MLTHFFFALFVGMLLLFFWQGQSPWCVCVSVLSMKLPLFLLSGIGDSEGVTACSWPVRSSYFTFICVIQILRIKQSPVFRRVRTASSILN